MSAAFLYDPYGIRTRVTAVKGRCLNRLTKGPYGGEGGIWTLAPVARPTPLAGAPLQPLEYFPILAPQVGFEPTTVRLTAECSTTELLRINSINSCKSSVLPNVLISEWLFKMRLDEYNSQVFQVALLVALPLSYCGIINLKKDKMGLNGLEPSTSRLSGVRSNQLSYRP